jgi:hypothetical protein
MDESETELLQVPVGIEPTNKGLADPRTNGHSPAFRAF